MRVRELLVAFAFFICIFTAAAEADAATYIVTNTSDALAGSLREAVGFANGTAADDVVVFNIPAAAAGCVTATGVCTITLASEIVINNNGSLTIRGTGANRLTIDGGPGTNRMFYSNGATFDLSGATLTNGNGTGTNSGGGGAIYANGGTLVLRGVNITGNTAVGGGGVRYNGGTNHQITNSTLSNNNGTNGGCGGFYNINGVLTVTNTTFSGNSTLGYGGGFCSAGTTTVRNSTITGNTGNTDGGGIWSGIGTLNIGNSIVAGNGAKPDINFDSGTAPTTTGYNLIGDNTNVTTQFPAGNPNANNDIVGTSGSPILAQVAPLANYGGTTPTRALCAAAGVPDASCTGASPAIDKGSAVAGVFSDGRAGIRPYDIFTTTNALPLPNNGSDIGAFELIPTSAFGWGYNGLGAVGDNTPTDRSSPTQIVGGFTDIVAVEGGDFHALGLRSNGTLIAWGNNGSGQLGDGTTTQRNAPVVVSGGLTNVVATAGGGSHSLALLADGTIRAWGFNSAGQLGNNSTTDSSTPVTVSGISTAIAVAAGANSSYALLADGSVRAWGRNFNGQLGDGTTTDRLTPVQVSGLTSGVISIDGGNASAYALLADGSVRSWGANGSGQLGDGTTTQRLTPVTPLNLGSNIVQIAGGLRHGVALRTDGTVLTWGGDDLGQLGDGTAGGTNPTPTAIALTNITEIKSTIGLTTYARRRDGSLVAWGDNNNGECGNGTITTPQATPLPVSTDTGIGFFGATGQNGYAGSPLAAVTAGANQFVRLSDATVSFPNVATAGTIQIRTFDPSTTGLTVPSGYTIEVNSNGYEITSTAQFTGSAQVCLKTLNVIDQTTFNRLTILHDDDFDGTFDVVTITKNYQKREICRVAQSFSPFVLAQTFVPTAANVSVSGKVLVGKSGLTNAFVTLTDATGATRTARTTSFGYYHFDNVPAGQTYVATVQSKRYQFAPQVVNVEDNLADLDFYALAEGSSGK